MNYYQDKTSFMGMLGEVKGQAFLHIKVTLTDPDPSAGNPVIDEKLAVEIVSRHIFTGFVVIQGRLNKTIIYKACKNRHSYINYQSIQVPFDLQVPFPGLLKYKEDKYLIRDKIINIESDILPGPIYYCAPGKNHTEDCRNEPEVMFNSSSLAQGYSGKYNFELKEDNQEKGRHRCQDIEEKVVIQVKVRVLKEKAKTIPVCKPAKVFHCNYQDC